MTEFRISEKSVAERHRRTARFVFVITLALLLFLSRESFPALDWVLGSMVLSWMFAFWPRAQSKYPWAMVLEEESRWVLRANGSSLQFDHQGAVSEIRGCDVEKIVVNRRHGEVFKIDIIYRDQRTRLQHYDRMDELLAFMLKISPDAEVVQANG